MQLNIQIDDSVLVSTLLDSLDAGFDHVEEYVNHILEGLALETLELVLVDGEDDDELPVEEDFYWVADGSLDEPTLVRRPGND